MSDFRNEKPKQVCYIYKNGFKSNDKQPDFKSTIKITPAFLQQMVNDYPIVQRHSYLNQTWLNF